MLIKCGFERVILGGAGLGVARSAFETIRHHAVLLPAARPRRVSSTAW